MNSPLRVEGADMTMIEIRDRTTALTATYENKRPPETLQGKVAIAWGKQVLEKLNLILTQHTDNTPELFQALKNLLEENHSLTQGTLLSYTARPESDITKLLTSVAVCVAVNTDQLAIQLLMPKLSLESLNPHYANLDTKDLNSEANIETLLKTHILGQGGRYLLPVKLLTELTLAAEAVKLGNPYFDYSANSAGACFVCAEELMRLTTHSPLTQAVWDKKLAYDALARDKSNLLGQLSQLCLQLAINSKHGLGQELNAASGAYPAIIAFTEYFDKLGDAVKATIPASLMTEIQTLTNVGDTKNQVPSIGPDGQPSTETNIETCIATRRTGLIAAMSGQGALLSGISLGVDKKKELIRDAMAQFETARADLNKAIIENTYQGGRDALGISVPLLKALKVVIHVSSLSDLTVIQSLSPSEILEVFKDEALKNETITQLRTLENLVIFAIETPPERLKAFLTVMADKIAKTWLHSPRDLSALLISLDVEKCGVVCESMQASLPAIITSGRQFGAVLQYLTLEQCSSVCESMQASLLAIVKSGADFRMMLLELKRDQRTSVFEFMKAKLRDIIHSVTDFCDVLTILTPAQGASVCESMQSKLPSIIDSAANFRVLLLHLTLEQHTRVFETMQDSLSGIIKSADNFRVVLLQLTPGECTSVCESMQEKLTGIITSVDDFRYVLRNLPAQQCQIFHDSIKTHWLNIVTEKDPRFAAVKQFVEIDTACSAILLKLATYKDNELLSHENKVSINSAIQLFTLARNRLREVHLKFMQNDVANAQMMITEQICCNHIAITLETHILPIRQEPNLGPVQQGMLSELVQAITPLFKQFASISEMSKRLCVVDPTMSATMAQFKADVNAKRACQEPHNDANKRQRQ